MSGLVERLEESGVVGAMERAGDRCHLIELGEPEDGVGVGGVGEEEGEELVEGAFTGGAGG